MDDISKEVADSLVTLVHAFREGRLEALKSPSPLAFQQEMCRGLEMSLGCQPIRCNSRSLGCKGRTAKPSPDQESLLLI